LIQKGANPHLRSADIRFANALQLVAYYGKMELVQFLLNARNVVTGTSVVLDEVGK
jgi:hypothetical protein